MNPARTSPILLATIEVTWLPSSSQSPENTAMFELVAVNTMSAPLTAQNIILANRYGWNITSVHSAGDEATRVTLKAYQDASREKPLEGRWGIDHQPLQTPETIALIKKLNVIPSFYYFTPGGGGLDGMVS